jgi:hypothetical protein
MWWWVNCLFVVLTVLYIYTYIHIHNRMHSLKTNTDVLLEPYNCKKWIHFDRQLNMCIHNSWVLPNDALLDRNKKWIYVVQSIISWTGGTVALLCTTADMWSHKTVPCPFFSCPSKQQLRECGVFRNKVTVVKGSCLQAPEIENVAVWATGKRQVLPKFRQIH